MSRQVDLGASLRSVGAAIHPTGHTLDNSNSLLFIGPRPPPSLVCVSFMMGSKSSSKYLQVESLEAVDFAGSGIFSLPAELLHLIASQLGPADIARLSTVSRHLRDVLSAPVVWSTIDCTGTLTEPKIKQIEASLERSRGVPLHVTLPSGPASGSLLSKVAGVADRIVTLTLEVRYHFQQRVILTLAAPRLQTLRLTAGSSYGNTIDIVRHVFSALKCLYLVGTITSHFRAPRLTRLVVDAPRGPNNQDLTQILGVLSRCASLEEFEITHRPFLQLEREHEVVHLPNLRTYIDSAGEHYGITLATKLSLPPTCSVTFNCAHEIHTGSGFLFPKPPIPPSEVTLKWTKLRIRDLKWNYTGGPNVERAIEGFNRSGWWFRSKEKIAVNPERELPIRVLTGITNTAEVKTLCIGGKVFASLVHSAEAMLYLFPGLETLILSDPIVESYLEALSPSFPQLETPCPETPCPDLNHLVIHILGPARPIVVRLAEVAWERERAGRPFGSVSFFTPELEEDLCNHLEEELKLTIRGNLKLTVGDEARFGIPTNIS